MRIFHDLIKENNKFKKDKKENVLLNKWFLPNVYRET